MSPKPVSASHPQSPSWPLETGPGAESLRSSCAAYQLVTLGWLLVSFSKLRVSTPVSITAEAKRTPYAEHLWTLVSSSPWGKCLPDPVPQVSQLLKAT